MLLRLRPFGPSSDPPLFSGFHPSRIDSSKTQWSLDHVVADNGSAMGEEGTGDDETNATFLEGEVLASLLPLLEPLLGVLRGERRQDFVGETRGGICTAAHANCFGPFQCAIINALVFFLLLG